MAASELAERGGIPLGAQNVSKMPRPLEDGATGRESVRLEDAGIEIETHWSLGRPMYSLMSHPPSVVASRFGPTLRSGAHAEVARLRQDIPDHPRMT